MQRTCTHTPTEAELRSYATGLDVSEYQDEPDWDQIADAGYSFVFLRSSSGKHVDRQFKRNWEEAHRVGLRVGVYHYFRAGLGGVAQADLMSGEIARYGGFQSGDLGPVLDLEEAGQVVNDQPLGIDYVLQESRAFLAAAQAGTDRLPLVYGGQYVHWSLSQKRPHLAAGWERYPLWVPSLTSCPRMPVNAAGQPFPWKTWTFWQYSHTGAVPGIRGPVDLNYFHGNQTDLEKLSKSLAPGIGGGAILGCALLGLAGYGAVQLLKQR